MLLENMNWKIGCVAGKYELKNRLLLENMGWKKGCVVGKWVGITCSRCSCP